jgi:hypothetical protein
MRPADWANLTSVADTVVFTTGDGSTYFKLLRAEGE